MVRNLKVERQGGSSSHDVRTDINSKKRAKLLCKLLRENRLMVRQQIWWYPKLTFPYTRRRAGQQWTCKVDWFPTRALAGSRRVLSRFQKPVTRQRRRHSKWQPNSLCRVFLIRRKTEANIRIQSNSRKQSCPQSSHAKQIIYRVVTNC